MINKTLEDYYEHICDKIDSRIEEVRDYGYGWYFEQIQEEKSEAQTIEDIKYCPKCGVDLDAEVERKQKGYLIRAELTDERVPIKKGLVKLATKDGLNETELKEGYCCDQYQDALENGIAPKITVPFIGDPNKTRPCCIFCGKNPDKYTNKPKQPELKFDPGKMITNIFSDRIQQLEQNVDQLKGIIEKQDKRIRDLESKNNGRCY